MLINKFSDYLASILVNTASCEVKRKIHGVTKPFWSSELTELKRLSVEAHRVWLFNGRPRSGMSNDNRLLCKSMYNITICLTRKNFEHGLSNRLASKILESDCKDFWAMWNSVFGTKNA